MGFISFEKRKLSNGLTVIHHHDASTPFVVVNMLYKVGAKDEAENKTGFAHLFEHLMFEGTSRIPSFDEPLQEAGGENNAFTTNDYTNYYDIVPAINAELPFCMEADRMRHLKINKTSLKVQQKVVCEEFKETCINQPYGDVWHILRKLVYEKHPYQWPTIGKELSHIADATLEDVKQFYDQYYVPNNAILAVGGNISYEATLALTEKWFGDIENVPLKHRMVEEPEQLAAKKETVMAAVPQDMIYVAFKMPERLHPHYYTADVITDILSTGASSRLNQRLVKESRAFVQADAYISGSNETGILVIEGRLAENTLPEKAEALIREELDRLINELVDEKELRKAKNKMLTYMNFSDANLLNRISSLAYYEMLGDAWLINKEEAQYEAVSSEDIQEFAKQYLVASKSNTLLYLAAKKSR